MKDNSPNLPEERTKSYGKLRDIKKLIKGLFSSSRARHRDLGFGYPNTQIPSGLGIPKQ